MRIETQPKRRRNRRLSGFSLIEVLVALVILVIGIFSILRLFPGGFLTILRTSEFSQAQALSQQQLDSQKQSLSVADSIVAVDPTDFSKILTDIVPDELFDNSVTSAAANAGRYTDPYFVSNINHFNRVLGETFKITASSKVNQSYINQIGADTQVGSAHLLEFGPVVNEFGTDGDGNPTDSLIVRGSPLQRTEQSMSSGGLNNSNAYPNLSSQTQYAIDYDKHAIAFLPRVGTKSRKFVFAYSYWVNNAGIIKEVSVLPNTTVPKATTILVPDVAAVSGVAPPPVWQNIFDLTNGVTMPSDYTDALGFKKGSDDVSRKFKLTSSLPFTDTGANTDFDANDPYEYAWNSPQYGANGNVGALIFNPAAANVTTITSTGVQGLIARVDYTIFDSHIIHEDRQIPASAPYDIRLSLQNILQNGRIGDNSSIYDSMTVFNGLFRLPGNSPDIILFDVSRGKEAANLTAGVGMLTLEDRSGILHLDQKYVEMNNLQNITVRVYYRSEKEWGMQLLKANSRYVTADVPGNIQYDSYYVGGSDAGNDGLPTRIYFPLCEAGKTVVVSEYYVLDSPGVVKRYTNESFRINNEPGLFETIGGKTVTWIDFSTKHPGSRFDATTNGRAVGDIRGGSVRSRVIWKDSSRWRKSDTELLITQPALQ